MGSEMCIRDRYDGGYRERQPAQRENKQKQRTHQQQRTPELHTHIVDNKRAQSPCSVDQKSHRHQRKQTPYKDRFADRMLLHHQLHHRIIESDESDTQYTEGYTL